jgi:predicted permease
VHVVHANFFETMELPIQLGRGLSQRDDANASRAVVINQALARRFFSGENPVGKRLRLGLDQSAKWEIVGVARDAKYTSLRAEVPAALYVSWLQVLSRMGQMNFEVRTTGDPASFLTAIRQAVHEVDGNLPLFDVKTQVEQASQSLAQEQLFTSLLSFFGLLALALASLGLYGVLAASVTQRMREIGVRMALGAQGGDVLKLVIGQGMTLTFVGVALGLVASIALTITMKSLLFGVSATDSATFATIALLLTAVALLACWIPARRATKVDPMAALRCD